MFIPLSLYIHIPWCIKKCPYCDFNSHALKNPLPEDAYLNALIEDLKIDLPFVQNRKLQSIFFGGGTPSLISPRGIENLLRKVENLIAFDANIEITLETNPGTVEHFNLADYKQAGINRISLGAQSFDDEKLKALGRIHCAAETLAAIEKLHSSNFNSFNIDLMHGLPGQTLEQAMLDLSTAIDCQAPHISWYQLTIEPNTIFHKYPPQLPHDELTWQIQTQGEAILAASGFNHYEVSAFAKPGHGCKHNKNYWDFGDYLGIGAGAHGKCTDLNTQEIKRTNKTRNPSDYLNPDKKFMTSMITVPKSELPSEYMLNRLRLFNDFTLLDYEQRTGLSSTGIAKILDEAQQTGFIKLTDKYYSVTNLGKRFLNDVMQMFLSEELQYD
jgi:putative oxygen-independent coproporphyrinogen III oxidase